MTTTYFIRHGEKQTNTPNPKLTKIGIKQAQQTGEYLSQFPINKLSLVRPGEL